MHIVFLNQYYPPDAAPTGVMLEAVVAELVAGGHEVTVICAAGGYAAPAGSAGCQVISEQERLGKSQEEEKGEEVVRCQETGGRRQEEAKAQAQRSSPPSGQKSKIKNQQSSISPSSAPTIIRIGATRFGRASFVGKLLDYASYYVGVAWRLAVMQPRPERIVALTTPPYLSVLARVFSKLRGANHAHWVMDLYPDVMVAHGMLPEGGAAHRFLAWLARVGFGGKRCAAVLTLGPDMAERVERLRVEGGGREETTAKTQRSQRDAEESESENQQSSILLSSIPDSKFKIQNLSVSWVPLWGGIAEAVVDGMAVANRRHERGWADDELVVMYSGNMGLGHRFGEILEVIGCGRKTQDCETQDTRGREEGRGQGAEVRDQGSGIWEQPEAAALNPSSVQQSTINNHQSEIRGQGAEVRRQGAEVPGGEEAGIQEDSKAVRYVFFGGGKRRGEVERFMGEHPELPVELHDYAPAEILDEHLRSADVHLVSLDSSWTGTMLPSKLQGIFAAGRPAIFIGDKESSIARWVQESGGGWVVAAGEVDELAAAIAEAGDPTLRTRRGKAAAVFAEIFFNREINIRKVAKILSMPSGT